MRARAPAPGPANTARISPKSRNGPGRTDAVNTLVVNAGSSSLKLRAIGPTDDVLASTTIDGWKGEADTEAIDAFARDAPDLSAVGHRVVHGGDRWSAA